MVAIRQAGHAPAPPDFLVTYGTGGLNAPTRQRVVTLTKLHNLVLTQQQAATEALHELWMPFTRTTRWERKQQHERLEATFPFLVAGALFNAEAEAADEEDEVPTWQQLSGLVLLTFTYKPVKANPQRTDANRQRLQARLLATPLLGSSIVFMCKAPGECTLYVLVAAGVMKTYGARACTIVNYLQRVCPQTYRHFFGADVVAHTPYAIGHDPQAWLRSRPTEGYATFPVTEAKAQTKACSPPPPRQRGRPQR